MGADGGPRRTPHPQPDPDVSRESMLFGGRCATGRQERSTGFPRLIAGRSSKTVPRWRVSDLAGLAGTVQGSWSSSGLGAVPCPAARLSSSRPTFAASPIPLDSRLRPIYASHATPACAVHFTGPPAGRCVLLGGIGYRPGRLRTCRGHRPASRARGSHYGRALVSLRHRTLRHA